MVDVASFCEAVFASHPEGEMCVVSQMVVALQLKGFLFILSFGISILLGVVKGQRCWCLYSFIYLALLAWL